MAFLVGERVLVHGRRATVLKTLGMRVQVLSDEMDHLGLQYKSWVDRKSVCTAPEAPLSAPSPPFESEPITPPVPPSAEKYAETGRELFSRSLSLSCSSPEEMVQVAMLSLAGDTVAVLVVDRRSRTR